MSLKKGARARIGVRGPSHCAFSDSEGNTG